VGGGTAVITASQAGNDAVNAAANVSKNLTVSKHTQTITWEQPVLTLPVVLLPTDRIQLTATATGGTVLYTLSNDSVADVYNGYLRGRKVGTVTVTARQLGTAVYEAAPVVSKTFTVTKGAQAIIWTQELVATSIDATITLQAVTQPSGLAVTYASSNPSVASISGNILTVEAYGTAEITATSTGNANYNAPAPVVKQITVLDPTKTNQTITWAQKLPDNATVLTAPIPLTATTNAAGLAITYVSDNTAVATVSGSTLTIVGTGVANIKAQQAGNETYNPASEVSKQLVVVKAAQTITWTQTLTAGVVGTPVTLTATTNATGLTVSYVSSNTAVATVSGSTLTFVSAGTVTITASQAGNDNYIAAANVEKTLTVTTPPPPTAVATQSITSLKVYPNPVVNGQLTIDNEQLTIDNEQLTIYNLSGGIVGVHEILGGANTTINIANLPAGTYIVKVGNKVAKIVKN
jgi:hypothetical protein